MSNTKAVLQNADLSKNEISNQVQESAGDNLHPSDPNAKTANACPEQNGKENSVEKGIDLIYLNEEEEGLPSIVCSILGTFLLNCM